MVDWLYDIDKIPTLADVHNFTLVLRQNSQLTTDIISMIVEPLSMPLDECWEINYPEVADISNQDFFRQNKGMAKKFVETEDNKKWINFYLFRAYKMVQAICATHNMKTLFAYSENFLDVFFGSLERQLQASDLDDRLYNANMLADLVLHVIKVEPYAGYNYVLFYNVPFLFMRFLDRPIVADLLLAVTCPTNLFVESTEEMANKFWDYFKQSDFFVDLFAMLTDGPHVDVRKMKSAYKPIRIPEMSKLMVGGSQQIDKQKARAVLNASRLTLASTKGIMVEDQKFIAADIDLVKKYQKEARAKFAAMKGSLYDPDSHKANPKAKQLVRSGTLELMPDENTIVQYIKASMPISAKYMLIITSPAKLAQIEPFKPRVNEDSHPKLRRDSVSARTNKSRTSRPRMSVL